MSFFGKWYFRSPEKNDTGLYCEYDDREEGSLHAIWQKASAQKEPDPKLLMILTKPFSSKPFQVVSELLIAPIWIYADFYGASL